MSNGKMMSGEWKMPKINNVLGTIRINPSDEQNQLDTIHIKLGAKNGIKCIFN